MDSMRSRIRWSRFTQNQGPFYGKISYHSGKIPSCRFYIHIYGKRGYWHWCVKKDDKNNNNLIIGANTCKSLIAVKAEAVKWTLICVLIKIDRKMFRNIKNGNYTICGLQSFSDLHS